MTHSGFMTPNLMLRGCINFWSQYGFYPLHYWICYCINKSIQYIISFFIKNYALTNTNWLFPNALSDVWMVFHKIEFDYNDIMVVFCYDNWLWHHNHIFRISEWGFIIYQLIVVSLYFYHNAVVASKIKLIGTYIWKVCIFTINYLTSKLVMLPRTLGLYFVSCIYWLWNHDALIM